MVKKILLLLFFLFLPLSLASSLVLSVDATQIPPNGNLRLDMIFKGFDYTPDLDSLSIEGFKIANRSSSSSVRIVNGVREDSITVSLFLKAEGQEGVFRIGPYEINYKGQKVVSNAIDVQISRQLSTVAATAVFLKASLSKSELCFGEQFFYILRIYRRQGGDVNLSDFQLGLPEFTDLISDQQSARQNETQEVINGTLYQVTEVRVPVFAARHGAIEIPHARVSYRVSKRGQRRGGFSIFEDDFFSFGQRGTQEQAYSDAVSLQVKPLPKPAPTGFSDLVGRFRVSATIDKNKLKVGDGATLTLSVEGVGSLQDFSGFNFEHEKLRIYEDGSSNFESRRTQEGLIGGLKIFKYAIVPKEAGNIQIPPFQLIYFDPETKEYATRQTETIDLDITAGEGEVSVFLGSENELRPKEKKGLKIQAQDIFPIRLHYYEDNFYHLSNWQWWLLFILPLLLVAFLEFWRYRSSFYADHPLVYAKANAWSLYQQEKAWGQERPTNLLLRLMQRKLALPLKEMTLPELEVFLTEQGKDLRPQLKDEILRLFQADEFLRYTGQISTTEEAVFHQLAKQINRELR